MSNQGFDYTAQWKRPSRDSRAEVGISISFCVRLVQLGGPDEMCLHRTWLFMALSLAAAPVTFAQHSHKFGTVEFSNSCAPAVQENLLRGVAMLHSFYYSADRKAFEDVAAENTACANRRMEIRVDPHAEPAPGNRLLAEERRGGAGRHRQGPQNFKSVGGISIVSTVRKPIREKDLWHGAR